MGDMDEGLPEEDIVRRKIEAINALVAYAFVCVRRSSGRSQSLERSPSRSQRQRSSCRSFPDGPLHRNLGRRKAPQALPRRRYRFARLHPRIVNSTQEPSTVLPYLLAMRPSLQAVGALRTLERSRIPASFAGRRTHGQTWDHLEDHLERAKGGPLACPREECKGMVLESPGRFQAHAARFHRSSFRARIKLETSESVKPPVGSATASARPITLVPLGNQTRPPGSGPMYTPTRTRIMLRIGGKEA
jgi:hypothetical protein